MNPGNLISKPPLFMTISYPVARVLWAPGTVLSALGPSILPWKEVTYLF